MEVRQVEMDGEAIKIQGGAAVVYRCRSGALDIAVSLDDLAGVVASQRHLDAPQVRAAIRERYECPHHWACWLNP